MRCEAAAIIERGESSSSPPPQIILTAPSSPPLYAPRNKSNIPLLHRLSGSMPESPRESFQKRFLEGMRQEQTESDLYSRKRRTTEEDTKQGGVSPRNSPRRATLGGSKGNGSGFLTVSGASMVNVGGTTPSSVSTTSSEGILKSTRELDEGLFKGCFSDEDEEEMDEYDAGGPSLHAHAFMGIEDTPKVRRSIGAEEEPWYSARNRAMSVSYVQPDELPPCKDEDTARFGREAMLCVYEVLGSESKTLQGFADPKMVLLRALFDVPDGSEYKQVANWVMVVFEGMNKSMSLMQWAIRHEVQTTASANSLFREDSMPGALASHFLKATGREYIQKVLGPPIAKMHQSKSCYEIDINKPGGAKSNEKRVRKLVTVLLKHLFDSVSLCPTMMRDFLFYMSSEIRDRFPQPVVFKTVCSFFFLHYICPAIIYPTTAGVIEKQPTKEAQRGLILAAKIIQNLANGGEFEYTEPHLAKINKMVANYRSAIINYMESMVNKTVISNAALHESSVSAQQKKLALEELQKYMTHKLKALPLNPTQEENERNQPLLRLRRALQAHAKVNLTRSTSSPSSSPRFNHSLSLSTEHNSPSKRRSFIDFDKASVI